MQCLTPGYHLAHIEAMPLFWMEKVFIVSRLRRSNSQPHMLLPPQILPAVVRFRPDIIFISAGFDAHKKDDLNYRYIGIAEKEYEWVTDQIVQVANRCED